MPTSRRAGCTSKSRRAVHADFQRWTREGIPEHLTRDATFRKARRVCDRFLTIQGSRQVAVSVRARTPRPAAAVRQATRRRR